MEGHKCAEQAGKGIAEECGERVGKDKYAATAAVARTLCSESIQSSHFSPDVGLSNHRIQVRFSGCFVPFSLSSNTVPAACGSTCGCMGNEGAIDMRVSPCTTVAGTLMPHAHTHTYRRGRFKADPRRQCIRVVAERGGWAAERLNQRTSP